MAVNMSERGVMNTIVLPEKDRFYRRIISSHLFVYPTHEFVLSIACSDLRTPERLRFLSSVKLMLKNEKGRYWSQIFCDGMIVLPDSKTRNKEKIGKSLKDEQRLNTEKRKNLKRHRANK